MTDVLVQEWNEEGQVLEWVGPLLEIADELLAEWEHPDGATILKTLSQPAALWPWSAAPLAWFLEQMNRHTKVLSVTYEGEVMA